MQQELGPLAGAAFSREDRVGVECVVMINQEMIWEMYASVNTQRYGSTKILVIEGLKYYLNLLI